MVWNILFYKERPGRILAYASGAGYCSAPYRVL